MSRVAVVGGGISGLATAYYASRAGHSCTLFDPAPRLGGVIQTETVEGCVVELGPDSFIAQKPWALELIRELGLESEVIRSNDHLRRTYVVRGGGLVPLPDGLFLMVPTAVRPVLASPLIGWTTKIRMGLELLRRPAQLPDRSAADFVREHYGQEAVDYLAEPLLAGIYGGDASELSAASVLPRLVELERKYGSLTRGVLASRLRPSGPPRALFLSLKGGMGQLVAALEKALAGTVAVAREEVFHVEHASSGFRVLTGGGAHEADHLVLATPAWAAATLVRGMDDSLADLLAGIRYHSSVTLALGYDRDSFEHPLDGFGFLAPRVERRLLAACTWVGTKFSHRVAEDRVLLRAFIAAGTDDSLLARPDESLLGGAREELGDLMGVTEKPLFCRVTRWRRAMAQYTVWHQRRVEEIQSRVARLPGLHLAGNAYIGIGIPDCVRTAQLAAARVSGATA